ncbi:MAG: T9SS type A sorting domain-containing protein [Ferruginibacter sp.]
MKKITAKSCKQSFACFVIIVLFMSVLPSYLFAQKKVHPASIDKSEAPSLFKVFRNYSLFRINTAEINAFANAHEKSVSEFDFEFEGLSNLHAFMYENDMVSDDYKVYAGSGKERQLLPKLQVKTYSGRIENDPKGSVCLTLADNLISGFLKKNEKMYLIEPLRYFDKNADASVYVVYEAADVVPNSGVSCGLTEANEHRIQQQRAGENSTSSNLDGCGLVVDKIAIASDYSMVQKYGLADAQVRVISAMNIVKSIYQAAAFAKPTTIRVVGQYFSTSVANDPYSPLYTGIDAEIMLSDFKTWGQAGNFGFSYDMAQLWTAKDIGTETAPGSGVYSYTTAGLAFVGASCGANRYSLVEDYTTNITAVAANSAHEIGHLLGAHHDVLLPTGHIMSATLSTSWTGIPLVSAETISSVDSYVNTVSCFFMPCGITGPPIPIALFTTSKKLLCVGNSMSFTDVSQGAATWSWTFTGGDISSSTAQNPVVTYTTPGLKTATLTITGNGPNSQMTRQFMVNVAPPAASLSRIPNGFANGTPLLHGFHLADINHPGSQTVTAGGSYTDNACPENTELTQNTTYTATFDIAILPGINFWSRLLAFIDYNNDGDFSDAGENIFSDDTNCNNSDFPSGQFEFTTPGSPVKNQFLRLRLVAIWCSEFTTNGNVVYNSSQVEDYAVFFTGPNTYTITVNPGTGGSISPVTGSFTEGSNNTYTITASNGYARTDVIVDGVSVGNVPTYTFTNIQANHTISATFTPTSYIVNASAGANGSISPTGTSNVSAGVPLTYTITPDACYAIEDVLVDGASVGAVGTYTFSASTGGSHTISASFVLRTYTITVNAGANGSITPGTASLNCGSNATYNITPAACYSIADVIVDGASQGAISSYTFSNITANHTISATFTLISYTITVNQAIGGSITPVTGSVSCGSDATYTIASNPGYVRTGVIVDGVPVGNPSTYTFNNVQADHSITATFVTSFYSVSASAGANGSISPNGTNNFSFGIPTTYTITPNACYAVADVLVDGVSAGAVTTYTFNANTVGNHTISATFVLTTYNIITSTSDSDVGYLSPGSGTVNCGDNVTYNVVMNEDYSCYEAFVVVDGVAQGILSSYTFTNVSSNHTISISGFQEKTYSITASAGTGGSITNPGVATVTCMNFLGYLITPDACHNIADVVVDGISQGPVSTYFFNTVLENHTISASFVLKTYTITATAGSNGSISPGSGSVNCGDNATYTITPDAGYGIADVLVDGVSQGTVGSYTFINTTADHTISATFVNATTFTIISSAGANGSITPNGSITVNSGASQSYSIIPAACYHIQDVLVDGLSVGAVSSYNFTGVTANHTISASFAINAPLTVSVSGPVNVCRYIGSGEQVVYTATSTGATGFTWITPPNVTVLSGAGTSTLTIMFQNGFLTQANKQLKVTALSACGNSAQFIYYLAAQAPGTPGPIVAGSNNVCAVIGTTGTITYTINSVPGAASYNWTAPSNTTINHPNGAGTINDTTVTLSFSGLFNGGNISVFASNAGCGSGGTRSFTITKSNPSTPSPISGPTNVCANILPNGTIAEYKIAAIASASSYNWNVSPATAVVTHPNGTGAGDTVINVIFQAGFTTGSVSVSAGNGCGTSGTRSLSLTKLNPATPGAADAIQTMTCPDRAFTYTLASTPANSATVQWTVPATATLISGQGTSSITVSYPSTAITGNVTVQALNNCASSSVRTIPVKLAACPVITSTKGTVPAFENKLSSTTTTAGDQMQLNVYPNPSTDMFNLQVKSVSQQPIFVCVFDLSGRQLEKLNTTAFAPVQIAKHLKAGVYLLEVKQGNEVKTMKLIKQ